MGGWREEELGVGQPPTASNGDIGTSEKFKELSEGLLQQWLCVFSTYVNKRPKSITL